MLHCLDFAREMTFLGVAVRMLAAVICGGMIGIEREVKRRPAGFRTHILICLGASVTILTNLYLYQALHLETDVSRIGAQVITGIGFIGAGTIIVTKRRRVKGLTTAAGLWLTAGIGLAIGAGLFVVGIGATVMMVGLQLLLHRFTVFGDTYTGNRLQFTVKNGFDFNTALEEQMKAWDAQVSDSKITRRKDGTTEYDLTIRRKKALTYAEIKEFMSEREDILSVSNSPLYTKYE